MVIKVSLEDMKKKAESKFIYFNHKVSKDDINKLIDNGLYMDGFSYLDLSRYDFSSLSLLDLKDIPFSSSTIWPSKDKLPNDFNPEIILNKGNIVNDDIRNLHSLNINGQGIMVAVIDSCFQAENHIEFKDSKIKRISLTNTSSDYGFYHMENVLSKIVGKNLGIAPGCEVLCYEILMNENKSSQYINALKDILNRVKKNEKIRIVNISAPLMNNIGDEDKKECIDIINELLKYNCEVVDSLRFRKDFSACHSDFLTRDNPSDYKNEDYLLSKDGNTCFSKASFLVGGLNVLEFGNDNGYKYEVLDWGSWAIAQSSGFYALCLQVNKNITWEEYTKICNSNANLNDNNVKIINYKKVIEYIKNMEKKRAR